MPPDSLHHANFVQILCIPTLCSYSQCYCRFGGTYFLQVQGQGDHENGSDLFLRNISNIAHITRTNWRSIINYNVNLKSVTVFLSALQAVSNATLASYKGRLMLHSMPLSILFYQYTKTDGISTNYIDISFNFCNSKRWTIHKVRYSGCNALQFVTCSQTQRFRGTYLLLELES